MKALIAAAVFVVALVPIEVLADTQVPFSAARFDGAYLFGQYRGPIAQPAIPPSNSAMLAPSTAPTMKCRMKMIPGDPKIDPGFLKPKVQGSAHFTIRAVEPPLCC